MAGILVRILTWFASELAFKLISGLGVSLFSMYFLNEIAASLITSMQESVTGLPTIVISILGIAGFDKYLSIVLGTFLTVIYLRSTQVIFTKKS